MKKIAIVIVNWNGKDDTVTCLDSLKGMAKHGVTVETVVVDNGSTNDSVAVIIKKHPWVTMLALKSNLGFTGGNNVGIRHALTNGAEFVWLLNNDTLVHPEALRILDTFKSDTVGIAGSKIYFAPGHEYHKDRYSKKEQGHVFWYVGGKVDWDNMYVSHKGVDEVDHGQYDKEEETSYITGCSFMIRKSVIEQIGVLDDRYYLYLEDFDYCMRAKKVGFKLMYNPKSVIWHVNAGSSGRAGNPLHEYYLTRNRLLIGMQYAPLRTKIALVKEAGRCIFTGSPIKRHAVFDAMLCKWGKQYEPKKFNT